MKKTPMYENIGKIDLCLPLSLPLTSMDICSASSDRLSSAPLPFRERARLILLIPEFQAIDPSKLSQQASIRRRKSLQAK